MNRAVLLSLLVAFVTAAEPSLETVSFSVPVGMLFRYNVFADGEPPSELILRNETASDWLVLDDASKSIVGLATYEHVGSHVYVVETATRQLRLQANVFRLGFLASAAERRSFRDSTCAMHETAFVYSVHNADCANAHACVTFVSGVAGLMALPAEQLRVFRAADPEFSFDNVNSFLGAAVERPSPGLYVMVLLGCGQVQRRTLTAVQRLQRLVGTDTAMGPFAHWQVLTARVKRSSASAAAGVAAAPRFPFALATDVNAYLRPPREVDSPVRLRRQVELDAYESGDTNLDADTPPAAPSTAASTAAPSTPVSTAPTTVQTTPKTKAASTSTVAVTTSSLQRASGDAVCWQKLVSQNLSLKDAEMTLTFNKAALESFERTIWFEEGRMLYYDIPDDIACDRSQGTNPQALIVFNLLDKNDIALAEASWIRTFSRSNGKTVLFGLPLSSNIGQLSIKLQAVSQRQASVEQSMTVTVKGLNSKLLQDLVFTLDSVVHVPLGEFERNRELLMEFIRRLAAYGSIPESDVIVRSLRAVNATHTKISLSLASILYGADGQGCQDKTIWETVDPFLQKGSEAGRATERLHANFLSTMLGDKPPPPDADKRAQPNPARSTPLPVVELALNIVHPSCVDNLVLPSVTWTRYALRLKSWRELINMSEPVEARVDKEQDPFLKIAIPIIIASCLLVLVAFVGCLIYCSRRRSKKDANPAAPQPDASQADRNGSLSRNASAPLPQPVLAANGKHDFVVANSRANGHNQDTSPLPAVEMQRYSSRQAPVIFPDELSGDRAELAVTQPLLGPQIAMAPSSAHVTPHPYPTPSPPRSSDSRDSGDAAGAAAPLLGTSGGEHDYANLRGRMYSPERAAGLTSPYAMVAQSPPHGAYDRGMNGFEHPSLVIGNYPTHQSPYAMGPSQKAASATASLKRHSNHPNGNGAALQYGGVIA